MFTIKQHSSKLMKGSLASLVFVSVSGFLPAVTLAQDQEGSDDIALIEEKAPLLKLSDEKISLLKTESSDKLEKAMKEGKYLSLKMPENKSFGINVSPTSFTGGNLQRFIDAADVLGRSSTGSSLATRGSGVDMILARRNNASPLTDGFSLQLSSAMQYSAEDGLLDVPVLQPDANINNSLDTTGILERKYNVGLALGYEGVMLDAKYAEKDDSRLENYKGLNLGLGYRSTNWVTRLGVSEYTFKRSTNIDLLPDGIRQLYQFELGGMYRFSRRLSVSAGVKVTDYGRLLFQDETTWGQSFYLGGRLSY